MVGKLASLHAALVDQLLASRVLTQPAVEGAFRAIPRHLFLPDVPIEDVYRDEAIATKMEEGRPISSSSQPAIMAIMLEQLRVLPGQHVLEIGAGTGYNAALLGQLVGPAGQVVTVDLDEDIALAARTHLAAAGSANVQVIHGDGGEGYVQAAPYDRIILTVGAWDITPAWHDQLSPGGRLVVPLQVGNGAQAAVAFQKSSAGSEPRFISESVRACGFMLLRGAFAGLEVVTVVGPTPGLTLTTPGPAPVSGETLYQWFMSAPERRGPALQTTEAEVFGSLALWLDLHSANLASLTIDSVPPPAGGWPCLFQFGRNPATCFTLLLLTPEGMAVLDGRNRDANAATKAASEQGPFELRVIGYGPHAERAKRDLLRLLVGWDSAGRPDTTRLRLRVFGPDAPYTLAPGEVVVPKRWTKTVIDWLAEPTVKV